MRSIIINIIGIIFLFPFGSESSVPKLVMGGPVHPIEGGSMTDLSGGLKQLSVSKESLSASSTDSASSLEGFTDKKVDITGKAVAEEGPAKKIDYKKIVIDYLDGNFEGIIPSVASIKASNVVNVVGEGLMAEFYRLLGDHYCGLENFSQAGQAYYEALHLPEEPEYHLNKFLSEIGISKRSTPEEIELLLQRK